MLKPAESFLVSRLRYGHLSSAHQGYSVTLFLNIFSPWLALWCGITFTIKMGFGKFLANPLNLLLAQHLQITRHVFGKLALDDACYSTLDTLDL